MAKTKRPVFFDRAHPVMKTLRAIRRGKRLSLREVGELAGYSENTLGAWERGKVSPMLDNLANYAEGLGMKLIVVPKDKYQERARDDTAA